MVYIYTSLNCQWNVRPIKNMQCCSINRGSLTENVTHWLLWIMTCLRNKNCVQVSRSLRISLKLRENLERCIVGEYGFSVNTFPFYQLPSVVQYKLWWNICVNNGLLQHFQVAVVVDLITLRGQVQLNLIEKHLTWNFTTFDF